MTEPLSRACDDELLIEGLYNELENARLVDGRKLLEVIGHKSVQNLVYYLTEGGEAIEQREKRVIESLKTQKADV